MSSDDGEEVTPVPIPNTEVKLFSADGSWGSPPVRVGRRWATWKEVIPRGMAFFVFLDVEGVHPEMLRRSGVPIEAPSASVGANDL